MIRRSEKFDELGTNSHAQTRNFGRQSRRNGEPRAPRRCVASTNRTLPPSRGCRAETRAKLIVPLAQLGQSQSWRWFTRETLYRNDRHIAELTLNRNGRRPFKMDSEAIDKNLSGLVARRAEGNRRIIFIATFSSF